MKKKGFFKNEGVQSFIASIICILLGLLIGFIVLLFINPKGAGEAMLRIIQNFLKWNRSEKQIERLHPSTAKRKKKKKWHHV